MAFSINRSLYYTALILTFLVKTCFGRLGVGFDCRAEKLFFKRRNAGSYYCIRAHSSGHLLQPLAVGLCADHFVIPNFIGTSATDPCICRQTSLLAGGKMVCPRKASQGLDIPNSQSYSPTLDYIYIPDKGCPGPFQRYINTYRSFQSSNSGILHLTGSPILDPIEECKFRCLIHGSCLGVLYGPMADKPKCQEFYYKDNETLHELSPSLKYTYFGKLQACNLKYREFGPVDPSPVQRTTPLSKALIPRASSIITNAKQIGGSLVSDKVNITSTQCYFHCTQLQRCAAADYNFGTKECWIHSSTHCASHVPTRDKCCDHFKKGLICSVRP